MLLNHAAALYILLACSIPQRAAFVEASSGDHAITLLQQRIATPRPKSGRVIVLFAAIRNSEAHGKAEILKQIMYAACA